MNISLEMIALAALFFAALAIQSVYASRREKRLVVRLNSLAFRVEKAELDAERQRGVMGKIFAQREKEIETKIRQAGSDLKRVEMQMRSPEREASESVELAIQLARAGEKPEQIVRKTGLSADIIDTISALHAGRLRH